MKPPRYLASVAILALVSCGSHSSAPPPGPAIASGSSPEPAPATPPAPPAEAAAPAPGARPSDADLAKLTRANNAFAFALWSKVASGKGDFAYSPLSAETALAMTWLGAKGKTAAQMQKVLGWGGTAADAADIAGHYTSSLGRPVTIHVANRLFGEKTYAFENGFLARPPGALARLSSRSTSRGRPSRAACTSTSGWRARPATGSRI